MSYNHKILQNESQDVDSMSTKKDNILERLNKRNKDRQNYLDIKLEQRNKDTLKLEGIDYFAQTFTERAREIESRINDISAAYTKKSSGDAPVIDLGSVFAEITLYIQELQRYLTTSTMFLTDFKIKSCQNILNELTASCEETRQKLLPKKKFGFSGKKFVRKPPAVLHTVINETTNPDTIPKENKQSTLSSTISNRKNAHILLSGIDVIGRDISICNVCNCLIELQGSAGSVQISDASNCSILCGPITRSLFAERCQNSTLAIACQQLRLHSSKTVRVYLHVSCRAIIEDCNGIEIAAYNYDYPTIEDDFKSAGLDKAHNNYTDVADFDWLSPDMHSPNWKLLKDYSKPDWSELRLRYRGTSIL